MVWLMIPTEFNGSLFLYKRIVRPYFLKHHGVIDDTLNKMKEQGEHRAHSNMLKHLKYVIIKLTNASLLVNKVTDKTN